MYEQIFENNPQVDNNDFAFKLEIGEPSAMAKEVARKELRETPQNIENGLKELRRLLKEEVNMICPLDSDPWMLSFLRPAHFYPQAARNMIRNYFNYRQKYPEFFKDFRLETVKESIHSSTGYPLPQRDQFGRRIYVTLSGKYWDLKKFTREQCLTSFLVQNEFLRSEPETQMYGIVIILDMHSLSLRQALLLNPVFMKRLVEGIQDRMAVRLKGYHIVYQPKICEMIFAIARPFIEDKFCKQIHFHGNDMSSLHRHIAPEFLPECYGGTVKTSASYGPRCYEVYERYENEFNRLEKYGYKS